MYYDQFMKWNEQMKWNEPPKWNEPSKWNEISPVASSRTSRYAFRYWTCQFKTLIWFYAFHLLPWQKPVYGKKSYINWKRFNLFAIRICCIKRILVYWTREMFIKPGIPFVFSIAITNFFRHSPQHWLIYSSSLFVSFFFTVSFFWFLQSGR